MGNQKRIHQDCESAVEDIRKKVRENLFIRLPFVEASRILGDKYWRGHLDVIPYGEIKQRYNRIKKWKVRKEFI